jgi:hypothetical protein
VEILKVDYMRNGYANRQKIKEGNILRNATVTCQLAIEPIFVAAYLRTKVVNRTIRPVMVVKLTQNVCVRDCNEEKKVS